ncbi:alpha/beta hydrolase [Clostridium bornimense]|uniref:alpha/beta fold hydrolase n=1 Tax=Clostridium bornimense TaxID=1216932 RepID=UPI001C10FD70|nr:alpha/beta hydrolase [uncultured Clostridium sp.]MBU5317644.1 alpha/beta hydrolase [Clostridium bornimense]
MISNVNNIKLYYEKRGEGRPLILLHGNGESHKIFDEAIEILEKNFTVYAIDLRGHGASEDIEEYHYLDMVEDIKEFIYTEKLVEPILYGFSDGGIIALLLASMYPRMLSRIIISGANIHPTGLKNIWIILFKITYLLKKDPKVKMMLEEPNISKEMLNRIEIPTVVLAGERDVIKEKHTRLIANSIKNSKLQILKGEDHGSYIIHSEKVAEIILMNT